MRLVASSCCSTAADAQTSRPVLKGALEHTRRFSSCCRLRFHRRLGLRPVNHENLADMLYRGRAQVVADASEDVLTRLTVIAQNAHLDEFVGVQAAVDFTRHRRSEAAAADQDGGFEGMGAGFERSKLDGRELQRHGNLSLN